MSTLRSTIDQLASIDLASLSDAALDEELVEQARAVDLLQYQLLRITAEVDRRRYFEIDGILSTARYLAVACGMSNSAARQQLAVARALEEMPLAAAALASGDLPLCKVRLLAKAATAHPDSYKRHEETLVEVADRLSVRQLHHAIDYWRQAQEGPLNLTEQKERSFLHASRTWEGMVRVDGELDPESGEVVLSALDAVMAVPQGDAVGDHHPTAGHRRAEALTHLCRRFLDKGDTRVGGEPPHLTVVVDLETLLGGNGTTCELERTGPIPAETARRLACDAKVSRMITRGRSEPLDVGRAVRTVTPAQRKALAVRDQSCRFPGCDRPFTWCDAHHIKHWLDLGRTDLDNLILLCRRHHTLVHEHGFRISGGATDAIFLRPDGTALGRDGPGVTHGTHPPW